MFDFSTMSGNVSVAEKLQMQDLPSLSPHVGPFPTCKPIKFSIRRGFCGQPHDVSSPDIILTFLFLKIKKSRHSLRQSLKCFMPEPQLTH